MLLKLEIYLDVEVDEEFRTPDDIVMMKQILQDTLDRDVKKLMKSKTSELNKIQEGKSFSFIQLSKEEIFERMRTKGK